MMSILNQKEMSQYFNCGYTNQFTFTGITPKVVLSHVMSLALTTNPSRTLSCIHDHVSVIEYLIVFFLSPWLK